MNKTLAERVSIKDTQTLSDQYYHLKKVTIDYLRSDGAWQEQSREVFDRGDGAVILLYDINRKTIILTRQLRLPIYLKGYNDLLIEACAGALDADNPESCIKKETLEETGYRISQVEKIFEAFMSPGAVTEKLHFFIAQYTAADKCTKGGGLHAEGEDIDVLEMEFSEALKMMKRGEILDAKTIMLLQYLALENIL